MFENMMIEEHSEALHATNLHSFGTPSQTWLEFLDSLSNDSLGHDVATQNEEGAL